VELKQDLMDIISHADFITLHVPNTPQTRHMIDAAVLAAMKPTAYLVNCARGPIVDETALIQALQEEIIAGAGVDVYDPEPPEMDNPLFSLPNTVCTPHIASFTEDGMRAMGVGSAEGVLVVLRGERPSGLAQLVNPGVWDRRR
jgi:D-3-phosphoglycerate dehydrogenase